ncbi:Hypothetical predicted protein [Lecanosticta acicola]|uniref:DUF7587 domain-containing protein n=1 Tax=Lecanosticta acicola TaxID=111012 RepID=A0AAI8Z580_9PEZI|nr:Hypothetical predicted protein [Lecanosticta acicola]
MAPPGRTGKQRTIKNPSKQQLRWTFEMRETVFLLYTDLQLTSQQREQVFTTIFKQHLEQCGFQDQVLGQRLSAQYGEREKGSKDWVKITATTRPPVDQAERNARRHQIQETARSLGLLSNQQQTMSPLETPTRSDPSSFSHHGLAMADGEDEDVIFVSPNGRRTGPPRQARMVSTPTPLSKRPAVATWDPSASDGEEHTPPSQKHRKTSRVTKVRVLPTPLGQDGRRKSRKPSTPTSTPRSKRTELLAYQRPDESTIMLTEAEYENIETQLRAPSEHAIRPPLPALLFRYWSYNPACDRDSHRGFTARLYYKSNVAPYQRPPSAEGVDIHMNRNMEKSPFISTSSRLIWIIQLVLKGLKSGDGCGRLSIIDTQKLDPRAVFWARPYHDECRKSRPFSKGAHRYRGTYEFLVWHKIPREAILRNVKAEDFLRLVDTDKDIAQALQFEILQSPSSLSRTKIPKLKINGVPLTPETTIAMARICNFLGLHTHLPEKLGHIVSDIVEGWGLRVQKRDEAEWYQLSTLFAREVRSCSQPTTLVHQEKVKFAFLDGVGYGKGGVNCKFHPQLLAKKQNAASAVGLASPAQIIANRLDAAKMAVLASEKMENRRLHAYHQRRITFAEDDDVAMLDDLANVETTDDAADDDDDDQMNEGSDDESTVFDFGSDGRII